ncbi:protein SOSEKI 3 [Impatiens glandulifera]|uniref:protein SOSEKI 3 n=1 Tax=Impatiens glandulifera TaxID=253017 RepID=UPI001FB0F042|nr:protein SOSEKI 3 [Impatiens glandulifera]
MEARVNKYRQLSPERAIVWRERSPKYQQIRRVQVVYYLCRNRQLEHPHVIEVPLSSTEGLYLRDVVDRFNVLRGRGMASMYSWSNKRSYKNGFVWHDLCEDDLILPSNGNEYVLKGSELFQDPNSARLAPPTANAKLQNQKQLIEWNGSSSSSSLNGSDRRKHSPPDVVERLSSSPFESPEEEEESRRRRRDDGKSCSPPLNDSLSLTEYKSYKTEGLANASTQTDQSVEKNQETCTRGVSTDDECLELDPESNKSCQNQVSSQDSISTQRKINTLESLIRSDASTMNSFRIVEEEDFRVPSCTTKIKASNILMQLISCGSISVKDHSFGIIPTYRPKFSHTKFSSPLFSTSLIRLKDKEYFSGSLVETCMFKEGDRCSVLKRSSSYHADRSCNNEGVITKQSKCIISNKQPSLISEEPRVVSEEMDSSNCAPNGNSLRFREEEQEEGKVIKFKVEERLSSGARIIIQSTDEWPRSVEED